MSASSESHSDPVAGHPHPALPPVSDEAPDSPLWLPVVGLVVFFAFLLTMVFQAQTAHEAAKDDDDSADSAPAEAADEQAPNAL